MHQQLEQTRDWHFRKPLKIYIAYHTSFKSELVNKLILPKKLKKTLFSEVSGEPSPGHFQKIIIIITLYSEVSGEPSPGHFQKKIKKKHYFLKCPGKLRPDTSEYNVVIIIIIIIIFWKCPGEGSPDTSENNVFF